jgi:hypothetical protein
MSIKKYTNIEGINNKTENEGQFLQTDDLFIVSKSEIETTDFGNTKYDVMEVSVYDINNNLLPHASGNNVAYIKGDDIKNYMYQITNKVGLKELAIDVEKLINDIGYNNGILKVNINFVRYKVGSENTLERVWIEEISPSREEIRILPLKTKFENINNKTKNQFENLQSLNKEFKYYKNFLLNSINSFEKTLLTEIDTALETKYGKDFFSILKKDFGLSAFTNIRTKIFADFKTSIEYYLNNKYYDITQSTFGKPSNIRFEDYDIYDFNNILNEIQNILYKCVDINLKSLKRRDIGVNNLPKEFAITELQKLIQNNLDSFSTYSETKRNVYSPDGTVAIFNDVTSSFVEPTHPLRGTLLNTFCKGYNQYGKYADGNGGNIEQLIQTNSPTCGYVEPTPPTGGGSGGSGGGSARGGRNDGGSGKELADDYRMDNQK